MFLLFQQQQKSPIAYLIIISRCHLDRRAILIMALSFSMDLGITQKPEILQFMPDIVKSILSSGMAAGGITAILLNLILPEEHMQTQAETEQELEQQVASN